MVTMEQLGLPPSPDEDENSSSCHETRKEITKCQLTSAKSGLFLLNEVALISSNGVTRVILEDIRTKVARICSDVKLKAEPEEMQPFSWHKFLDVAALNPHMSLTHARMPRTSGREREESGEATNISPEEVISACCQSHDGER